MKISKKSWHYRLMRFFNMKPPDNLCQYIFVLLVALPFQIAVIIILLPLLLVVVLIMIIHLFFAKIGNWFITRFPKKPKYQQPSSSQQHSLLWQWAKAKKQNICPFIEYED